MSSNLPRTSEFRKSASTSPGADPVRTRPRADSPPVAANTPPADRVSSGRCEHGDSPREYAQVAPSRPKARDSENPPSAAQNADLDKLGKPCRCPGGEKEDQRSEARETMLKRGRSKWLTLQTLDELENLDSPVPYSRARSCCSTVVQEDGTLKSSYCRSRWCLVCNRIRMGTLINRYEGIMRLWRRENAVFFVTLSRPNVPGSQLRQEIREMKKLLRYCRRSLRETRGFDQYRALENWEVTYSVYRGDYHPHIHIFVRGKAEALALIEEWLKRSPDASRGAQDMRMWDGKTRSLIEGLKYSTKMIAPGKDDDENPPASALDTIFRALKGLHLCNPAGFDVDAERERAAGAGLIEEQTRTDIDEEEDGDEFDDLKAQISAYSEPNEGRVWTWEETDWIDRETGECLTGYCPSEEDHQAVDRPGESYLREPEPTE